LGNKIIDITFFRYYWYWPFKHSEKGNLKIKLTQLNDVVEIKNDFEFELKSKRCKPKLSVCIKIRTPIAQKQYTIKSVTQLNVSKIYKPFRGEGAVNLSELQSEPVNRIEESKSEKKITQSQSKQSTQTQQSQQKQKPMPTQERKKDPNAPPKKEIAYDVANDFTTEDLNDPDNKDNLNSLKVLDFKIKKVDAQIKKIEGRTPRDIRNKFISYSAKKQILSNQMGDGSLTPDQYIVIMKTQLDKDQKLQQYFQDKGDKEKQSLISERIPVLINEIKEGVEFLKKSKK